MQLKTKYDIKDYKKKRKGYRKLFCELCLCYFVGGKTSKICQSCKEKYNISGTEYKKNKEKYISIYALDNLNQP